MEINKKLTFLEELLFANNGLYASTYDYDRALVRTNCPSSNTLSNLLFLEMPDSLYDAARNPGKAYIYTNSLSLSWALLPYEEDGKERILVLGPVFYQEFSERVFRNRMDMEQMSVASQINLLRLMHLIPVISSANLIGFTGMYYHTLFERKMTTANYAQLSELEQNPRIQQRPNSGSEISITTHGTYAYETEMLRCVEEGDLSYNERLESLQKYLNNQIIGTLSPTDPLRQTKDSIIVQTALVTRAAIRGGMDPDTAYSLSDFYIQRIESSSQDSDVLSLSAQMYSSFINHVHTIKNAPETSPPIRQCCAWIQKEITSGIQLNELSARLGYTPYYLSTLFKEETGLSFRQYVSKKKIEHAKFLLTTTNLSIAEISDYLSFSTPSYFINCFRRETGTTPKQYRQNSI